MAKDDYYVIVYKIFAYLYVQLKAGADIDPSVISNESVLFDINYRYWSYIMENIQQQGLIKGLTITKPWGADIIISDLECCQITPDGISYLCDNSFISKAKDFLKEVKDITPFI